MAKVSAGILMFRRSGGELEILLVHPGGPYFAKRDAGTWSIPKGEPESGEPLLDAARREFEEETGFQADGEFVGLTPVRQRGGKLVHAWAVEGTIDVTAVRSMTFSCEWPPGSGRMREFPEVDRAAFMRLSEALTHINPAQAGLLTELVDRLGRGGVP
jgi:predicted NUDIX family NTP pyrophosphohydrolase